MAEAWSASWRRRRALRANDTRPGASATTPLHQRYPDPFERAQAKLADAEIWGTKLDLATIDHVINAVGIDHVGLSSHAQSVPQWKEYTAALIDHGYSETDAAKIVGENVVRVLASA